MRLGPVTKCNKSIAEQHISEKHRMSCYREELLNQLIAEWKKLAQKEGKQINCNIGRILHFELYNKFELVGEFK